MKLNLLEILRSKILRHHFVTRVLEVRPHIICSHSEIEVSTVPLLRSIVDPIKRNDWMMMGQSLMWVSQKKLPLTLCGQDVSHGPQYFYYCILILLVCLSDCGFFDSFVAVALSSLYNGRRTDSLASLSVCVCERDRERDRGGVIGPPPLLSSLVHRRLSPFSLVYFYGKIRIKGSTVVSTEQNVSSRWGSS